MIKIYRTGELPLEEILLRGEDDVREIEARVRDIIENVRKEGDKALYRYAEAFDGAKLDSLKVTSSEIDAAYARVDKEFVAIMEKAAANIREFHSEQVRKDYRIERDGAVLGQRFIPVACAGLYVPGGTASYPSTVLMNAIPAKIAGVKRIIMCTPPDRSGKIADAILAAAKVAGVDEVYKSGGAQAVAAMAYGTESVPRADKIVGPGNIYVATAKKLVQGVVGIDMIAGPSEILVIADESARADYVAADMLSQAEHDRRATAILITPSERLAEEVASEIEKALKKLAREEIARVSIENNGKIIVAGDLSEAVRISNELAPEHLELSVEDPEKLLPEVTSAGSVFLGHYTPEAVGDYLAGSNHTLPTSGTARFSSPLSVDDFIKKSQYISYSREALDGIASEVMRFAKEEGLTAHAASVAVRYGK